MGWRDHNSVNLGNVVHMGPAEVVPSHLFMKTHRPFISIQYLEVFWDGIETFFLKNSVKSLDFLWCLWVSKASHCSEGSIWGLSRTTNMWSISSGTKSNLSQASFVMKYIPIFQSQQDDYLPHLLCKINFSKPRECHTYYCTILEQLDLRNTHKCKQS